MENKVRAAILNFHGQFSFNPVIKHPRKKGYKKFVLCGMGGSALSGDLIRAWDPSKDIIVWRDYGLPPSLTPGELKNRLIIISSYSGNTEEALSSFETARKGKFPFAVITVGGRLLTLAKKYRVPYILLPDTDIQPRMALGLSFVAVLALMGEKKELKNISSLHRLLHPALYEKKAVQLTKQLGGKVPLIYASHRNGPLAYIWKIKFNENSKSPAFANVVPELNHNEMTGFDFQTKNKKRAGLQKMFHVLVLNDPRDDEKYKKRLSLLAKLYQSRGVGVTSIPIEQKKDNPFFGIFASSILADWTSYYLALHYGADPFGVPMVEEFKKKLGTRN